MGWQVGNIYFIAAIAVIGGGLFGFDISSMSAILPTHAYRCYFNQGSEPCKGPHASVQGGITAAMAGGSWLAALVSGFLSDILGRKKAIMIGAVIWCIGSAITSASQNIGMLIVGRIINGMSVGICSAQVPVYITELAPPTKRGRLVGCQQWAITWGIMIMFYISYGCSFLKGTSVFRVPWGLQMIPAVLLLIGMLFLPESPRWLARKERWDEAHAVLTLVHGKGDPNNPWVAKEYREIQAAVEFERQNADVTYLELLKPHMINRTHIGVFTQIWSQLTGMNVMMYYITYVFAMANLTGNTLLVSSSIQYVINVVMTVPALLFMDRWGRRPTLLVGAALMATWLFANAGLLANYGTYVPNGVGDVREASTSVTGPASKAVIACSYLFVASFAPTWGPVSWVYPPELYPLRVRGKAVALATSANWAFNFALGYFVPPAFVNIQWRTYIIFGVFCIAMFTHVFFMFPETAGKPLEEVNHIFEDPHGIKYIGTPAWKTRNTYGRTRKMEGGQIDEELATPPEKSGSEGSPATNVFYTALRSITLTNPSVALDADSKIIYRRPQHDHAPQQVSIISGGGSGHEPSFAAFVGKGLLAGAVAGTIFASPSAQQVQRCIMQRVDSGRGVLVVVMNYTGDILNFGMAVEKAKASGLDVEMVVVADDVGVGRKQGGKVGRRGIAGTVLVHKITGALAATGASLKEVSNLAQLTADNLISIGASLSHVHVPGRSVAEAGEDDLKEGEVEVGMGIHNEPGSERIKADLPQLVKKMLAQMLDPSDEDRSFLQVSSEDDTVLLVNNLGGVSVLELGGITNEVVEQLEKDYGIKPVRILAGTFMTSLNGLGFSISLLKLRDTGLGSGKSMLELLDAPAEATGWSAAISPKTWETQSTETREESVGEGESVKPSNLQLDPEQAKKALNSGLQRLIKAEPDITNYDTITGDGDCGIGLKRGAEAIQKLLERTNLPDDAAVFLHDIIQAVEKSMDGTSGALYAIFLNALAHGLRTQSADSPKPITVEVWANALQSSLEALSRYTPAKPGDRTLMDTLNPFVETLAKSGDVKSAAEAAKEGSERTKAMEPSLGRTVYIGGKAWQGVPDPGAYGLSQFFLGLSEGLQ